MQIRAHRDREYKKLCLFAGNVWYGEVVVIVEICRRILSLYYYCLGPKFVYVYACICLLQEQFE